MPRPAASWHTKNEKKLVKRKGAKSTHPGPDAVDRNGKPFEVRECKKHHRFRLQKNVHKDLLSKEGYYVFKRGGKTKRIGASKVDDIIAGRKWSKDRKYPYKFIKMGEVF